MQSGDCPVKVNAGKAGKNNKTPDINPKSPSFGKKPDE
jgi:hypothetical protein